MFGELKLPMTLRSYAEAAMRMPVKNFSYGPETVWLSPAEADRIRNELLLGPLAP